MWDWVPYSNFKVEPIRPKSQFKVESKGYIK